MRMIGGKLMTINQNYSLKDREEKRLNKINKKILRDLWENFKSQLFKQMKYKKKTKEKWVEKIFEKIMSENFQYSMTGIHLQIQETQQTQIWQNQREPYLGLSYLTCWKSWENSEKHDH